MKKIILLVYKGFFTQHLREFQNINLNFICEELSQKGFAVELLEYAALGEFNYEVDESATYWVGSHQNPEVKQYINDVLFARFFNKSNIVPPLQTIIAHENKGLQGMLAKELGIAMIPQSYHCSAPVDAPYLDYPAVFKKLDGAGSSGVSLVYSNKELISKIKRNIIETASIKKIKEAGKNIVRQLLNRKEQAKYLERKATFVSQSFIPNLAFDYKVLVLGDKCYFLKRNIKKGDFRASGSGQFELVEHISTSLIEFALNVKKKLNTPYCSLDLVEYGNGEIGLIEFQTVHFGPYTLFNSIYAFSNSTKVNINTPVLESELVGSLVSYYG